MIGKIFGAYDIRGKYPLELNEETVRVVSSALTRYCLKGRKASGQKIVVLGRDGRLSSPSLYRVLRRVFREAGNLKVIDAGPITTPMLYFLVGRLKAVMGVIVTASHNPKNYNGLKIVGRGAKPISGREVKRMLRI